MENLNSEELLKLYLEFTKYRDDECDCYAKMGVKEFYLSRYCGVDTK